MDLPSWLGLPTLRFGREDREPLQGLVLAGGGSRASFQIGALRHLYDVVGISPQVTVATSAGSIVACTLSQSSDRERQSAALRELEQMWLAMEDQSDMFAPRAWFSRLLDKAPEWTKLLDREVEQDLARHSGLGLPKLRLPFSPGDDGRTTIVDPADPVAGRDDEGLTGQAATLALATRDDPPRQGAAWSPGVVMQVLGALSKLTRDSGDIATILRGADISASTYRAGPILAKLLDREFFRSELLSTSGMKVRLATVALESGQLRFMTESGELVDRDNRPIGSSVFDVSKGVLASCSIPGVFRPVELDGEHYVDGGLRENVPVEMAVGHLGVTHPYVVTCSPQGVPRSEDMSQVTMLDLVTRSISLLTDECERDEVAYARNAGAVVISPQLSVHDTMTVDPGLLAINRDYGWMRSAQVHLGDDTGLVDEAVRLRVRGWEIEKAWLAHQASAAQMDALTEVKRRLVDVAARLPEGIAPEGVRWWGRVMERHGHAEPVDVVPWVV